MKNAELFVTNFNPRLTGVSATTAAVLSKQRGLLNVQLVGHPLPGCPSPVGRWRAIMMSRRVPEGRPFSIWHVRRNSEMQLAVIARDVFRLPIRIVFTSAAQRRHSAWPRWLISRMDAIIATTREAASFVQNVWAVVPHGVDTDRFRPADDPAAAWKATGYPGDYGIATVGRIRPEKGTDLFVEAMIEALPNLPGATALVIGQAKSGDAGFLDQLKRKVAEAGMRDRIMFIGEKRSEDMPSLLQGCRALVALPRYEGYGLTPLEAMACGLPVIASETGYFREFIEPQKANAAGRVVPLDDAPEAARSLVQLLGNQETYESTSRAARERAHTAFGIMTEVEGINAVYERLWSGAGNAPSHTEPTVG